MKSFQITSIIISLMLSTLAGAAQLPPLTGHLLPDAPAPVTYFATKPLSEGDPCSVALVIVQGWGDKPNTFIPEAQAFREAAHATLGPDAVQPFVVNPLFPRPSTMRHEKLAEDGRAIWNDSWEIPLSQRGSQHDDWRGGGDARGTAMSSYDVIDRIFAALADRSKYPNLKRVVLAGFSAGGQFAGRYAAVGKGKVRAGVEVAYVSLSPSTHLRLDSDVAWHYGLKDRPRYSKDLTEGEILANLSSRTIWYGCGEFDTSTKGALDRCPEAVPQGTNRLDRFLNFEKHVAQHPGWARNSSFHVIPGISHKTSLAFQYPELVNFILGRSGIDRKLLADVLSIPSETKKWDELRRCAHVIGDWLERRGVYVTYETTEEGQTALYAATTPGKVHDYFFVGHFDVVSAPKEMYAPRFADGKVYARGACDTKGNDIVMCQVLANLVGTGASVAMFLACDEEGGGGKVGTPQVMLDRGYRARKLILVGDTAGEEPGQLFTAEKGHAHFDIIAHGKGGHSSRPWATDNPIPKLFEGYLKFRAAWDPNADPNEHWRTILSPTKLKGSSVANVIPDTATLHLSCRYISYEDLKCAEKTLKETTGLEIVFHGYGRRPVVNKPGDPEIAALLKAMGEKLPGGIREGKMSAATDASYFASLGIPIVIWTATGGEPHSVREWGLLSSFDDYATFFTDYFKSVNHHRSGL